MSSDSSNSEQSNNPEQSKLEQAYAHNPSKRDKLRPLEMLLLSAVLGGFAFAVVGYVTDDWLYRAAIAGGAAFIIALLVIALLGLSFKPNPEDIAARRELDELHRRDNDGAHS